MGPRFVTKRTHRYALPPRREACAHVAPRSIDAEVPPFPDGSHRGRRQPRLSLDPLGRGRAEPAPVRHHPHRQKAAIDDGQAAKHTPAPPASLHRHTHSHTRRRARAHPHPRPRAHYTHPLSSARRCRHFDDHATGAE